MTEKSAFSWWFQYIPFSLISALEHPRAHEHAVAPQLHHQHHVIRCRDSPGGKADHKEPPELLHLHHEVLRCLDLLREGEHLVVIHPSAEAEP